jgi:peptidoglycan/LPS O-acetylase OafA/YrhL
LGQNQAPSGAGNNFNLLRLALASLVMLSHSFELIDGNRSRELLTRAFHTISFGELAVDGFFLLSGYLIVGSYIRRPHALRFLQHRVLRIYPGFLVCLAVCALTVAPIGAGPGYFAAFDGWAFVRGALVLDVQGIPPTFTALAVHAVNGSLWSLGPEFQCYLLALTCGLLGAYRRPWLWIAVGLAFATLYSLHAAHIELTVFGKRHDFYRLVYRLGMFFVAGGYLGLQGSRIRYSALGALGCCAALILCLRHPQLAEPGFALFGGYVLLWLAQRQSTWLEAARRLPDFSYGTYLYGWPIQQLLLLALGTMHPLLLFVLSVPLAWLTGLASWYGVERPCLALKDQRWFPPFTPAKRPSAGN